MQSRAPLLLLALLAGCSDAALDAAASEDEAMAPHAIQGDSDRSPFAGRRVTVEGVVSGDFQDYGEPGSGRLGGFYLMSVRPDGDPGTSDGLFVFEQNRELADVHVGDRVRVQGEVGEFFGETQLAATEVEVVGSAPVAPVAVSMPLDDPERFEGMLLEFAEPLAIADTRYLARFGQIVLSAGGRPFQFTNRNAPDPREYARSREDFEQNSLILDDGLRRQNVSPPRYTLGEVPPRTGNAITGLTGTLRYSRGAGGDGEAAFRLMPTVDPAIEPRNPRPAAPAQSGPLRVASYNLLNLFSGINSGRAICGPRGDSRCRGANSRRELERQLDKTVTAIRLIDADIVGVSEIENNARASLELLVEALQAAGETYAYVDAGVIGTGSIKVGFLYRPATIETVGEFVLIDRSVDGRFDSSRNRPALAQTFRHRASGESLTIVTNHLKSKGSPCDDANDPNRGDGQGNCNRTRTLAAAALADWALGGPSGAADERVLIIGDLNAYLREDPIRALEAAGLVNLVDRFLGDTAYSFVFDGRAGALDYAFASPALAPLVTAVVEWHINADEPRVFDYNTEFGRAEALFDGNSPWRASDHDPVIVDIDFGR